MAVHKFTVKDNKVTKEAVSDKPEAPKKLPKISIRKPKKAQKDDTSQKKKPNFLRRFTEYFVGAWHELRQVRWPNRKQTWELTLAVILFSVLLGGTIFGLDAVFTWLFTKVIL